ncbi:Fungal transcriptional regulatory protein [Cordyceps militaris CM01]|uniref:Fungal transcriptional regulatory protein n=1 Tax=Cordyceps militaris (strain CM01) TaxID=983644 RepID=G3J4Y3_CORMM|nr:Fungal transcriptional regulatory protein [Cordyceps militaris CM01]EGX96746.1 Fungal transcriptional regulatory protein [Cordyceps militaris CM01]
MVNVAGRSKGCAPCRRRKVKCDLGVPQCRRCIDLRLACPGPRLGAFFVHAQAQPLLRVPPAPGAALLACRASAHDQLFLGHFISSFGLSPHIASGPTWLERLPSFLGGRGAATASIRSAAMLSYGTWAGDAAVRADAYRWGAAALVEAAGPEACRDGGFLLAVLSHLRFQVFLASMQDNTLHAFAGREWREVPFRGHGKTLFDELVDALFAVQECLFFVQQRVDMGRDSAGDDPFVESRPLVEDAAEQLSSWNERYMRFLRPASWDGSSRGDELMLLEKPGAMGSDATVVSTLGLPEAALMSLFHAGRLIIAQLASVADAGLPDTAEEDSWVILQANRFSTPSNSPPSSTSSKLRPFMMLPGLKIASLWSPVPEVRTQAAALLLNEQILTSPMAELALTSDGYFSEMASSILNPRTGFPLIK